jgi:hypothetical protein
MVWVSIWDFLWFVLNPAFGWDNFRPENVWWHRGWLGRIPIDYCRATVGGFVVAAAARWLTGDFRVLAQLAIETAGLVALTALTVPFAPAYHRFYLAMRRPGSDERALLSPGPGARAEQ